jgi:uncharacterized protein (TIRG00374 family)
MSKKGISAVAGVVIGLAFFALSLRNVEFNVLRDSFSRANFVFAVAIVVLLAAFFWLKAMRWRDILSPVSQLSSAALFPSTISGAACNNLLPAHLGEIVRIYMLGHEYTISKAAILATLIVERIFDFVAVLILTCIALIMLDADPAVQAAALFLAAVASAGLIITFLAARHPDKSIHVAERVLRFLPTRFVDRIPLAITNVFMGLLAIKDPKLFVLILVNSLAQWLAMALCIYSSFLALDIAVSAYAAIVVLAFIVAGVSLPTSPGFIGTIQFCFVFGLEKFGIDSNAAFAASVFYHAITFFAITITGLYFMYRYGLKLRTAYQIGIQENT